MLLLFSNILDQVEADGKPLISLQKPKMFLCHWPFNPWPWKLYQFMAGLWEVFMPVLVEVPPMVHKLSRNS